MSLFSCCRWLIRLSEVIISEISAIHCFGEGVLLLPLLMLIRKTVRVCYEVLIFKLIIIIIISIVQLNLLSC